MLHCLLSRHFFSFAKQAMTFSDLEIETDKSSHQRCYIKKAVLKKFAIFTILYKKTSVLEPLFNKDAGLQAFNWHRLDAIIVNLNIINSLTLSCVMVKNDQTYFKNLAV